jgi:chromosome partitioning protein
MKVITVGSTKGGAGKTNTAVNLAVASAKRGKKVLIVDADVQSSALSFRALREDSLVQATAITTPTLHKDIPAYAMSFDLVLIDVGGRDSTVFRSAIAAADLLVIPVLPSVYDIWAAGDTMELLREARSYNIETPARIFLNQVVPNTIMGREAGEALSDFTAEAQLLTAKVHHRQVFKNAAAKGQGVVELEPGGKAAWEIEGLLDEILELV